MKSFASLSILVGILVTALFTGGCGGGSKIDTAPLKNAFASADSSLKSSADEAARALEAGKLFEGSTALANLARSAETLTDDQRQAMEKLAEDIQVAMSEDPDKMDLQVWQAVEDMMAALQGRASAQVGTNPDRVRPPEVFESEE